jgi:hypothetical protein
MQSSVGASWVQSTIAPVKLSWVHTCEWAASSLTATEGPSWSDEPTDPMIEMNTTIQREHDHDTIHMNHIKKNLKSHARMDCT